MSVIAAPVFALSSFSMSPGFNDLESRSVFGAQTVRVAFPQWIVSMTGIVESDNDSMALEQYLEALDGMRNQTEIYHVGVPEPVGTLRGALTLMASPGAGAKVFGVAGGAANAFKTLKRGDLLGLGAGVNQHVVRVAENTTADGNGSIWVTITIPLRTAFGAGTEVRWDRPKILCRQVKQNTGIEYVPGKRGQPFALQLVEDWRP